MIDLNRDTWFLALLVLSEEQIFMVFMQLFLISVQCTYHIKHDRLKNWCLVKQVVLLFSLRWSIILF